MEITKVFFRLAIYYNGNFGKSVFIPKWNYNNLDKIQKKTIKNLITDYYNEKLSQKVWIGWGCFCVFILLLTPNITFWYVCFIW